VIFFLYSTVFVSVFFRREYHVHCDDHVLTTVIYKQISTIFLVTMYTTLYLMVLEIREQLGTKVDVPQNLCSDVFSKEP